MLDMSHRNVAGHGLSLHESRAVLYYIQISKINEDLAHLSARLSSLSRHRIEFLEDSMEQCTWYSALFRITVDIDRLLHGCMNRVLHRSRASPPNSG